MQNEVRAEQLSAPLLVQSVGYCKEERVEREASELISVIRIDRRHLVSIVFIPSCVFQVIAPTPGGPCSKRTFFVRFKKRKCKERNE